MYAHVCVCMSVGMYVNVYAFVCVCLCMYTHVCVCMSVCMYVHVYAFLCVCLCMYVYACLCACTCICMSMYAYTGVLACTVCAMCMCDKITCNVHLQLCMCIRCRVRIYSLSACFTTVSSRGASPRHTVPLQAGADGDVALKVAATAALNGDPCGLGSDGRGTDDNARDLHQVGHVFGLGKRRAVSCSR